MSGLIIQVRIHIGWVLSKEILLRAAISINLNIFYYHTHLCGECDTLLTPCPEFASIHLMLLV